MTDNYIEIAKIVNVHGTRGEVKLIHFCDSAFDLEYYSTFYLSDNQILTLEKINVLSNTVLVKFKEIKDINQALLYKDKILYITKKQLKELQEGIYYIHDLIGCEVILFDDRPLGKLIDVLKTGANDVYVIENKEKKQYLIPAIKQVINNVDIEKKVIKITPIKGMIDDED
jgi:16S rRNA processing protein RimM